MDIVGKETLEEMLASFTGTVLFVSHDRYFINKISNGLLVFENGKTSFYPYGYSQYLENKTAPVKEEVKAAPPQKQKKYEKNRCR